MSFHSYLSRKLFWFQDFTQGGVIWREYKDIRRIYHGGDRITLLDHILKYTVKNVAFYKNFKYVTLQDFPIVSKKIINENYEKFLVSPKNIPGQKGELHIQKTSGSTGIPFLIPQDTKCRLRRLATIKFENDLLGFHSFEPLLHLRATSHYWKGFLDKYDKKNNIWYSDNSNLTEERLKTIIDIIRAHKIRFVRGYMTTLDFIADYLIKYNITLPSKPLFISVGELLTESLRKKIVYDLKCNIVSQYATEENGIFGTSPINEEGTTIKLNRANCIIEILKLDSDQPAKDGEIGRIVVTDLINHAMPLIRYDTGDLAAVGKRCKDGYPSLLINLSGRKTDLITRVDGSYVDFYNSIPKEIFLNTDIKQWQFIQEDEKIYTLRLSLAQETASIDEKYVTNNIKNIIGDSAIINFDYVNEIPVLDSGKRRSVINKYQRN